MSSPPAADGILVLRRQGTDGWQEYPPPRQRVRAVWFDLCGLHHKRLRNSYTGFSFHIPCQIYENRCLQFFPTTLCLGQTVSYSGSFFSLCSAATARAIAVLGGTPLGHTRLQFPYNSQAHHPLGISARCSREAPSASRGSIWKR